MNQIRTSRSSELTVQQMTIFCEVYDHESYAEAARALDMTPPSVWSQVQLLEQRYDVQLFKKDGRRVTRTQDATRLREIYRPILAGLETSFDVVGSDSDHSGSISIVSGMRMALEELPMAVSQFRKSHPEIAVRWYHADNRIAQDRIDSGDADIAVMLEPMPEQRSHRLEFRRAYSAEYLAILPAKHPLARMNALTLEDLVHQPLIIGHGETFVRRALETANHQSKNPVKLNISVETDNSAITIACVRQGLGIGVIAGRSNGSLLKGLHLRPLNKILGEARIVVAWKRGAILRSPVEDLIRCIAAV
jgi:DNA-binding transcriptional LysR family regulator